MNRRQFFGMTATALAAAGLPLALLPEKTIFLPPANGWPQTPLRMREIRQYVINNDTMPMRYDVAWGVNQWHVDFPEIQWDLQYTNPKLFHEMLEEQRSIARRTFEQIRKQNAYSNADLRLPALPRWTKSESNPDAPWDNDVLARYV